MAEFTLSKKNKLQIFSAIKGENNPFGLTDDGFGYLKFLESIWDLATMPSEDPRYTDARGDVIQHTVNNNDWDDDYLFIQRLKLLDDDAIFIKFLETVVNYDIRESEDEIIKFVLLINPYLEKEGLELYLSQYNEDGQPVYYVQTKTKTDTSIYIKQNDIPFYVDKNSGYFYDKSGNHRQPKTYPSFALAHNNGWNDYGYETSFHLFYYDAQKNFHSLGDVKILEESQEEETSIPDDFINLDDNFFSLGQDFEYYKNLKIHFPKDFESILYALKDSAFFIDIQEKFEKTNGFRKSLIRFDGAERLLREARYVMYDFDLSNLYSFTYSFQPLFSNHPIDVKFNFNNKGDFPSRMYGVIGKNGTGKTQLITKLPIDISNKKDNKFTPKTPLFSKVIAVSYSVFDNFEVPKKTVTFNYSYCGIRNDKGEIMSEKGLLLRFHYSWKKIEELNRVNQWRKVLLNFIEQELVDEFLKEDLIDNFIQSKYKMDIKGFGKARKKLSSGQSIILYIISEIVSNIRYDSLVLFDEPETHLHPNAVTQLVNTIYNLLEEFESYCIITTHSPLIIRELFSKNVYVIEKHENTPSVRRIGIESFGEDPSVLTEDVFGNKEIPKHYKSKINELVEKGYSYEKIISSIGYDNVPLSLNAKIYIKSIIPIDNA